MTVSISKDEKKAGRKETVIAVITVCHNISGSSGCVSHFTFERGTVRGDFFHVSYAIIKSPKLDLM